MKKLGIIITGSVPYSKKIKESDIVHKDIQFSINFESAQYSNEDLTQEKLFELVLSNKELPKTSQPSYMEIKHSIDMRLKDYEEIIVVVPSRELSGTFQGTINVVKEINDTFEKQRVFIIEALSIAVSEIDIVERIIDMKNEKDAQEISQILSKVNNNTYAFPTDSNFLKISGRVSGSQALLIGMLKIRPVVIMEPYKRPYFPYKGRGFKSILKYIDIYILNDVKTIDKIIFTKIALSKLEETEIIKLFESKNVNYEIVDDAPPVVATHFGPNSFGLYVKKK